MQTNSGGVEAFKTSASSFGRIVVGSSSASSYTTSYRFYNYDTPVTNAYTLSNVSGTIGYPLYYDDYVNGGIFINIKAAKGSVQVTDGTWVTGTWSPTY